MPSQKQDTSNYLWILLRWSTIHYIHFNSCTAYCTFCIDFWWSPDLLKPSPLEYFLVLSDPVGTRKRITTNKLRDGQKRTIKAKFAIAYNSPKVWIYSGLKWLGSSEIQMVFCWIPLSRKPCFLKTNTWLTCDEQVPPNIRSKIQASDRWTGPWHATTKRWV